MRLTCTNLREHDPGTWLTISTLGLMLCRCCGKYAHHHARSLLRVSLLWCCRNALLCQSLHVHGLQCMPMHMQSMIAASCKTQTAECKSTPAGVDRKHKLKSTTAWDTSFASTVCSNWCAVYIRAWCLSIHQHDTASRLLQHAGLLETCSSYSVVYHLQDVGDVVSSTPHALPCR